MRIRFSLLPLSVAAIGAVVWYVARSHAPSPVTVLHTTQADSDTRNRQPAVEMSPCNPISFGVSLPTLLAAAKANDPEGAFTLLQCAARRELLSMNAAETLDPTSSARLTLLQEDWGVDDPLEIVDMGSGPHLVWVWFTARDLGRNRSALVAFLDTSGALLDVAQFSVESATYEGAEDPMPIIGPAGDAVFFTFTSRIGGTGVSYSQWNLLKCPEYSDGAWYPARRVFDGLREGYAGSWFMGGLAEVLRHASPDSDAAEAEDDGDAVYRFIFSYRTSWQRDTLVVQRRGCFDCAGQQRPSRIAERTPANIQMNEVWRFDPLTCSLVPAF